jgi:ribosome-associated protein
VAARRRITTLTLSHRTDAALAPLSPASRSVELDVGPLARTITISLEDAKAEDIVSIDLRGKTTLADLMVIASGRSNVHVAAIADRLLKAFKSDGRATPRIEGLPQGDWVLLDAHDAIIHIFRPEVRKFYNLEKLWGADRPGEKRQSRAL